MGQKGNELSPLDTNNLKLELEKAAGLAVLQQQIATIHDTGLTVESHLDEVTILELLA